MLFLAASALPFAIWMLRSFFMEVHPGLREAALVDGATEWQVLTRIMSPLVLGGTLLVLAYRLRSHRTGLPGNLAASGAA